jgi:hypothetical protein
MQPAPLEAPHATPKPRTRRIWYGHGSSRLVTQDTPNLPPAAIDEAITRFKRIDAPANPVPARHAAMAHHELMDSIAANLSS